MHLLKRLTTPTRHHRANELVGMALLLSAILLSLSLVSYRPSDPSFDTVTAHPGVLHNWIGPLGARLSDLLLQVAGAPAMLLPLVPLALGWAWLRSRPVGSPGVKLLGLALASVAAPVACALMPGHLRLFGALPVEGIAGRLLADPLLGAVNYPGSCVIVAGALLVGVYLLTSFSFNGARGWAAVRFAFVAAWRDRMGRWRQARAERRQQRRDTKLAAQALRGVERPEAGPGAAPTASLKNGSGPGQGAPSEDALSLAAAAAFLKPEEAAAHRKELAERPVASGWDDDSFQASLHEEELAENAGLASQLGARETEPDERAGGNGSQVAGPRLVPSPDPRAAATSGLAADGIAFARRADIDQRPVTVTQKSVAGFESAYKLPPSTLLHRADESEAVREDELRAEAQVLIEKCAEFDVGGQVTQINPGPVVTTFEFRPEAGVKYARVTGLAEDLCLAMAAESILIERMAGKSTVGIQVPNARRETIWLRDVIEAENFVHSKSRVPIAMGKDINGRIVTADLATMPHVLIAGSTGSGKSVAINAMIMSVLYKATPEQVRLILVDPKRVELGMYEGIPHLFTPIITEPKLAANALKNAVREMERRLKLLASKSVRNIDQYNKLFTEGTMDMFDEAGNEEKPLPYIVVIIDELADLMILDRANVEEAITRIAQMARAVGIHLVLATQRPSVDVITGLIKANVPTRMSFRLATKVDSRTILDANGAESLLGRGDMLFLPPGTSRLQRVHAPFVTEAEISAVTSFWKAQGEASYAEGFLDAPRDAEGRELDGEAPDGDENDPLFDDAVRLVFEFGKASTSLLQRRMRIGYGRAAHLIDLMERDGLVGPPEGSKPRELLKPATWLNEVDGAVR